MPSKFHSTPRSSDGNGGRPAIERIGLFSEGSRLESSLPPKTKKPQEMGKQFITSPPKENVYFTKNFRRAFEGEAYSDLVLLRRQMRLANNKKNLEPAGFRPSNVPQKSCGKGSIYGTISHQYPLKQVLKKLPESEPEEDTPKRSTAKSRRNFYTSPSKKGGYGYVDGCISKPYPYISSPYYREQELNSKARALSKKKNISDAPFIGSSHETPYFDANPFKGLTPFTITTQPKVDLPSITWKPNSCCYPFLNTFPDYQSPFPQPTKTELETERREKIKELKSNASTEPKFKPVGATCHSYPIKSLIQMNIKKAPPAHIKSMLHTLRQSKLAKTT